MQIALIAEKRSWEWFRPFSILIEPKQLLSFFLDKFIIRDTVDRILPIISIVNIFTANSILDVVKIKKELLNISKGFRVDNTANITRKTEAMGHDKNSNILIFYKERVQNVKKIDFKYNELKSDKI